MAKPERIDLREAEYPNCRHCSPHEPNEYLSWKVSKIFHSLFIVAGIWVIILSGRLFLNGEIGGFGPLAIGSIFIGVAIYGIKSHQHWRKGGGGM